MSKPVNIAPTPGGSISPPTLTTRDWNIPPRPKPGRKPAGDAPPTKRKAQNREAQRAFRERRAARVGELEEHLKDFRQASQKEVSELQSENTRLQSDIRRYSDQIISLQHRQAELESLLQHERQLRHGAESQIQAMRQGLETSAGVVNLPGRGKLHSQASANRSTEPMDGMTCGKCDSNSRCQCVEEFMTTGESLDKASSSSLKEYESLSTATGGKQGFEANEIDFTTNFSSQRPQHSTETSSESLSGPSIRLTNHCGFCRTDNECICAAMVQNPSLQQQQQPPTTRVPDSKPRSCTNNPGSCDQCRGNPRSTVFCKTLAASRAAPQTGSRKLNASSPVNETRDRSPREASGPTLTCADAFSALSRHHAFPQASEQLGSWVSQLVAVPADTDTEGRTAFEIEAATVMSVLRFFDTRYGQSPAEAGRNRR